jgi:hypothetical protein
MSELKLSEKLKERLKLLLVNRLVIESGSPTSYISGYTQAICDVEIVEDNWIKCADEMPPYNKSVQTYWPGDKKKNPVFKINERPGEGQSGHGKWWASRPTQEPTHWAELVGPIE